MNPNVYTRTYYRALYKYLNNGFFARDLDADDMAFIEHIRDTGQVGAGSLAQLVKSDSWDNWAGQGWYRYASEEEREYWRYRWTEEPGVERGRAPPPKTKIQPSGSTPAAKQRIANKIAVSSAREEMWREYRETQARLRDERERRILQNMLADIEWQASEALERAKHEAQITPKEPVVEVEKPKPKRLFRKPAEYRPVALADERNHYIPEWRRPKPKPAKKPKPPPEQPPKPPAPPPQPAPPMVAIGANPDPRWEAQQLQLARIQVALKQNIKERLLGVIRGTSRQWTIEDLCAAIGMSLNNRDLVIRCAEELAGSGYIGKRAA